MLPFNDAYSGGADYVEQGLSEAYRTVKEVRDALDPIRTLADSLDFIGPATGIQTALDVAEGYADAAQAAKTAVDAQAATVVAARDLVVTDTAIVVAAKNDVEAAAVTATGAATTATTAATNAITNTNAALAAGFASRDAATPRRLCYGVRNTTRTMRKVYALADAIPDQIVGFAGIHSQNPLGTTGGRGFSIYYVKNPSTTDYSDPYSFASAYLKAVTAGGGVVAWDPTGYFEHIWDDRLVLDATINNITFWAPGRNVVFWCDRLNGMMNISGQNHIYMGIQFRPMPGPNNGGSIGLPTSVARTLVQVRSDTADRIAWIGCEWRHPSWHCLDISRSTPIDASGRKARFTVQQCLFQDAIQGHLLGTLNSQFGPSDFTNDASPRELFVTFYQSIWAYGLQRNPRVLGNAYVDVVDCLTLLRPYETEYQDGWDGRTYNENHTDAFGADVSEGGWLRYRGSLVQSTHALIDNKPATKLLDVGSYSGNSGRISVEDSYAENGLTFATKDAHLIPVLPYDLPHTPVSATDANARDAKVRDLLAKVGARRDAAPEGLFLKVTVPDDTAAPICNGETVVSDLLTARRDRTVRLLRVDNSREYATPMAARKTLDYTPIGATKILGKDEGRSTGAAIEPAILDITGQSSKYFPVSSGLGSGVPVPMRDIVSKDGTVIADGLTLRIFGSSTNPVTLKQNTTIAASVSDTVANTFTVTGHGRTGSGFQVRFSTTGTLPAPLVTGKAYSAIYVDANTIKVAASYADALAGNAIDITDVGTGSHTAVIGMFNLPNSADVTLNSSAFYIDITYNAADKRFNVLGAVPVTVAPALVEGEYTPTLTNITANISASPAPSVTRCYYSRVPGSSYVTVHYSVLVTPTVASAIVDLGMTLPIASNLATSNDLLNGGTNTGMGTSIGTGYVFGDATNDRVTIRFTSLGTGAHAITGSFRYKVI